MSNVSTYDMSFRQSEDTLTCTNIYIKKTGHKRGVESWTGLSVLQSSSINCSTAVLQDHCGSVCAANARENIVLLGSLRQSMNNLHLQLLHDNAAAFSVDESMSTNK
jgi:hypothetical protein